MVFGLFAGIALGAMGGLYAGSHIFSNDEAKFLTHLMEEADQDDRVGGPETDGYVNAAMRPLLAFEPGWCYWPDYERTVMPNRILKTMWPKLTRGILAMVLDIAGPIVQEQLQKFPFIEEVTLGKRSINGTNLEQYMDGKEFTLGFRPARMGGMKVYDTIDDEVVIELPLIYGGDIKMDIGVYLRFGPVRLFVPLSVSDVQFKLDLRITLAPLTETLTCVGGATVSMLSVPHFDASVRLFNNIDLLALPGVREGLRAGIEFATKEMLVYPNQFPVPLMPNFGVPTPPVGMLTVTVVRAEQLKGGDLLGKMDPYVLLTVRDGRYVKSRTSKTTSPTFGETFDFVVDDVEKQRLTISVLDDDLGWSDHVIGEAVVHFVEPNEGDLGQPAPLVPWVLAPGTEHDVVLKLEKPGTYRTKKTMPQGLARNMTRSPSPNKSKKNKKPEVYGTLYLKVKFQSFSPAEYDDDSKDAAKKAITAHARRNTLPNVTQDTKGVLTVKLVRCYNLGDGESVDPYVKFILVDPTTTRQKDEVLMSRTVFNDDSPRWSDKFDFVNVCALSTLTVEVWDKTSALEGVFSLKLTKRFEDVPLGTLRIPVRDVARNGSLKDTWTLQEVENGQIELLLTWQTCQISDDAEGW